MATPTPLHAERTVQDEARASWAVPMLTLALQVLEDRVLLWLVALGAAAIWIYTITAPDLFRIIAASLYSMTVLWPFLLKRR